jgi:hypothetical protein
VTQGDETGALVHFPDSGDYLMIQPDHIYRLLQNKIKAALKAAATPD